MPISLRQAARLKGSAGTPLPSVWFGWSAADLHLRRGHLHLVAASPGGGKTVLALNLALKMRVPTQYFVMDGDSHTMCVRCVQAYAEIDGKSAEEDFLTGGLASAGALRSMPWLSMDFATNPNADEIMLRTWAYAEMHGQFPELIVIDNLMDIDLEGDDEGPGLNRAMDRLSHLAAKTGAAVLVLHHVTGEHEDGHSTIPLSGLRYKVGKKPTMVLTMNRGHDTRIWVSVVKYRFGAADPSGLSVRIPMVGNFQFMQLEDVPENIPGRSP